MKKLFIVVNVDYFFLSHRKDIALRALKEGFDVTIIAEDTGKSKEIESLGLHFINLPINKTGTNIFQELKTFRFLYSLFKKERPEIVHLVGLKTILWGGLAAKLVKVKGLVTAVSGLGVMFSPEYNKKLMPKAILKVLRFIHNRKNTYCVFHNTDDIDLFIKNKIIDSKYCIRTMGSGIDLNQYKYKEEPKSDKLRVLFTARMVEDKGVLVLIEAANILRDKYQGKVEFLLCGGLETNPLAVSKEKLNELCDGDYIQWLGKRSDVKELLESSHIFAFPSYYKEGLPKSCIEAAAIGRPIITCDSVGCRDTVVDGETGFLVPIRDSKIVAEKLDILFEDTELRKTMGIKSRKYAEDKFSIEDVIQVHLDIYNKFLEEL
ncbi:MAG: glycosyltransferase family 4 protein [Paludibacteraceae bacterium]|nr:glycosyltransferase family 4 protein [Paludibacteraceae bacterium]